MVTVFEKYIIGNIISIELNSVKQLTSVSKKTWTNCSNDTVCTIVCPSYRRMNFDCVLFFPGSKNCTMRGPLVEYLRLKAIEDV